MPTSIALSPHFEDFIRQQVDSGRFNNVSEVVRAGLRLLEDSEMQHAVLLETLKAEIAKGQASGPAVATGAVFERLEAKYIAQSKA
jgi:antitoxin ParD1/3/4